MKMFQWLLSLLCFSSTLAAVHAAVGSLPEAAPLPSLVAPQPSGGQDAEPIGLDSVSGMVPTPSIPAPISQAQLDSGKLGISSLPGTAPVPTLPAPISSGQLRHGKGLVGMPGRSNAPSRNTYGASAATHDLTSTASVVSFAPLDQKLIDETSEDLEILSLILSQRLEQTLGVLANEPDYKLGIPMLIKTSGRPVDASYIQGFGVMLKSKVRFPLVAPDSEPIEEKPAKTNSEWEQARREINEPKQNVVEVWYSHPGEKSEHYNTEFVDTLKRGIVETLKNASNLRHVKPDEWVVVSVCGAPNLPTAGVVSESAEVSGESDFFAQPRSLESNSQPIHRNQMPGGGFSTDASAGVAVPSRCTMMTVRVKKNAADSLAGGEMTNEQFSKAVEVTTYFGPKTIMGTPTEYVRLRSDKK